jgi:hypothetical protein
MSTQENKNSFDWVWRTLGATAGVLAVFPVTTSVGPILLGAIIGLIIGSLFLNKVVKGRSY